MSILEMRKLKLCEIKLVEIRVEILTHFCLFQTLFVFFLLFFFLTLLLQLAKCFFDLFSFNLHNNLIKEVHNYLQCTNEEIEALKYTKCLTAFTTQLSMTGSYYYDYYNYC